MHRPVVWHKRKQLSHAVPGWVGINPTFFITCSCAERGNNLLCIEPTGSRVLESIAHRHARATWHASLALLMPDHVHLIVSFPEDVRLQQVIGEWKSYTAKSTGVKWQRDFFDYRIRDERDYCERAEYIRNNPVRAGLVANACDWPYVWEPPR